MAMNGTFDLAKQAEQYYDRVLRARLEPEHRNEFVAVEPISGDYFLGQTLSEAIGAARDAYPDRLSHALRIGHKAALHFGIREKQLRQIGIS